MSWDLEGKANQCRHEGLRERINKILLEGEDTPMGRMVTIKRIKEVVGFKEWLKENERS